VGTNYLTGKRKKRKSFVHRRIEGHPKNRTCWGHRFGWVQNSELMQKKKAMSDRDKINIRKEGKYGKRGKKGKLRRL